MVDGPPTPFPSLMHKFSYTYDTDVSLTKYHEGNLKNIDIEISSADDDMSIYQLLNLFKSYALSVGYAEKSFYDACEYYYNECDSCNKFEGELND